MVARDPVDPTYLFRVTLQFVLSMFEQVLIDLGTLNGSVKSKNVRVHEHRAAIDQLNNSVQVVLRRGPRQRCFFLDLKAPVKFNELISHIRK
jgi:hypothetical protein